MINVVEYLLATAHRMPDKTAVVYRQGSLTFGQLLKRGKMIAAHLPSRHSNASQPVAVYLPKSADCLASFAGILLSGNCYAPLDTKTPIPRLAAILERLKPAVVITDSSRSDDICGTGFGSERMLLLDSLDEQNAAEITPTVIDTDPAYILHTSGSTGIPKAVVVSHRGIRDYIDWARTCYCVTESDTIGNQAPFFFDNSTLDIYLSFSTGATLVLLPEEDFLFPLRLIERLREHEVHLIFWVASVLSSVASRDILSHTDLPALRKILFAGEVMPAGVLNYWRQKFPNALFSNLYGPTEITVDCTYYIVDRQFSTHEPVPIGSPRPNMDVLIINEGSESCGVGERGEICVRGSAIAHGYWNDPKRTAEVFVQNPLNPHYPELIYRTGDIGYRNERGEIIFVGRRDQQIKHMGYRIELGDIEAAAATIPEINQACVVYNPGNSQIVLFCQTEGQVDNSAIRRSLLDRIPKYMIPSVIRQMDVLPLNANGKLDRERLAAAALSGA